MKRYLCILLVIIIVLPLWAFVPASAEETEYGADDFKTWLQGDPRWGNYVYGQHSDASRNNTIKRSGCMITSIAILIAYSNPAYRDWKVFNPQICVQDYLYISGNVLQRWDVKEMQQSGAFTYVESPKFSTREAAKENIRKNMEAGNYSLVYAYKAASGSDDGYSHFSPVVGWNEETDEPIIWDVGRGLHTNDVCEPGCCWNTGFAEADGGSFTVASWSSNLYSSQETIYNGSVEWDPSMSANVESLREIGTSTSRDWEISGMPSQSDMVDSQLVITLPNSGELSWSQQHNISTINKLIEDRELSVIDIARIAFSLTGLIVTMYAVFLVLAYLFDRVNSFIDVSFVTLLSFGKLKLFDGDKVTEEQRKEGYITDKALFIRIGVIFAVGFAFLSGLVSELVYWIASLVT